MAGLNQGHRQRLKARFLREGLDFFEPHNILELLLFYSIPQQDTNHLAHRLLAHFGSLSGVLNAPYEDLMRVKGVGEHTATLLKLSAALVRPYLEEDVGTNGQLLTTEEICRFLIPKFVGRPAETMILICLDSKRRLLYHGVVSEGTHTAVPVTIKMVAEKAMSLHAAYVVLAHNHPNGFAIPSRDDLFATERILDALKPLDIVLQDHIIVSGNDAVSMRDSGAPAFTR